ncbi:MAG: TRAP transporter fused permease subunit [Thermodesulfobacteriota bacterium]
MYEKIGRVIDGAAAAIGFSIGLFHLLNVSGTLTLSAMNLRVIHLMAMLVLVFLLFPRKEKLSAAGLLFKVIGVALSVWTSVYAMVRWLDIIESGGLTNPTDTVMGIVMVALVLEATRRSIGLVLSLVAAVFLIYPFVGSFLPGLLQTKAYGVERVFNWLFMTTQGIYGIPISVSASYIILFCIYGAFLSEFGVGDFFFRLSASLTSNLRAATAKTAIVFSTLVGMISGSAAGNVAVTGSITIPMMIKKGYRPEVAGAVEAIASTGGQIMPPVMGAAAFIMAEIIGVPYSSIMKAAIIPALLYFITIYIIVHLQALKGNIDFSEAVGDKVSTLKILKEGWYFIIPIAMLIFLLIYGYSPFKGAYFSILTLLAVYVVARRDFSLEFLKKIFRAIKGGAHDALSIALACAAAGIIVGILTLTGVGSKMATLIIDLSQGSLLAALILTMFTSLVLGMGLPTTAAYLILASVVAPALVKMGLSEIGAHMFVFFYGCISTITPPVALASYVAAGLAGANANTVGWTAFKFGTVSFILPYMFVFGPNLLMQGSFLEIIWSVSAAVAGVFAVAACVVGYLKIPLHPLLRGLLLISGTLLINQGLVTDIIGISLLAAVYLYVNRKGRMKREIAP